MSKPFSFRKKEEAQKGSTNFEGELNCFNFFVVQEGPPPFIIAGFIISEDALRFTAMLNGEVYTPESNLKFGE